MKIVTDLKGNVKGIKNKTKEDKEIEVDDNVFAGKNPLNYRVIKKDNSIMVTPKSKQELKKTAKENIKICKTIEEKVDLIIEYLGLN
jgi:hypothetical protein